MKIKTNVVLLNPDKEAYKTADEKDLTLGHAIAAKLAVGKSTDPLKSYILTKSFLEKDEIELTAEDITFVKNIIKESDYFPYIAGQIMQLLES